MLGAWLCSGGELGPFAEALYRRACWHRRRTQEFRPTAAAPMAGGRVPDPDGGSVGAAEAGALWGQWLPPAVRWTAALRITCVDAGTAGPRVWSSSDGVGLAVAVACSTAAPRVVPAVRVDGRCYVDGAVRSTTNADLVTMPTGRVLVLAPLPGKLKREVELLRTRGCEVRVVAPDERDREVFERASLLDPELIAPAAESGRRRGAEAAAELHEFMAEPAG